MSLNLQHQIRQNALELQDYLRDLREWEHKANSEPTRLKETSHSSQALPVRGICAPLPPSSTDNSLKRDSSSVEAYYNAWNKFDVVR